MKLVQIFLVTSSALAFFPFQSLNERNYSPNNYGGNNGGYNGGNNGGYNSGNNGGYNGGNNGGYNGGYNGGSSGGYNGGNNGGYNGGNNGGYNGGCREGAMFCDYYSGGFYTCAQGRYVLRQCGPGTRCQMIAQDHPICNYA